MLSLSFAIPIPVSETQNSSTTLSSSIASRRQLSATRPLNPGFCGVNLIALPTRFVMTWRRRSGSPISWSGMSLSTSYVRSSWACEARTTRVLRMPKTVWRTEYDTCSIVIRPASTVARHQKERQQTGVTVRTLRDIQNVVNDQQ